MRRGHDLTLRVVLVRGEANAVLVDDAGQRVRQDSVLRMLGLVVPVFAYLRVRESSRREIAGGVVGEYVASPRRISRQNDAFLSVVDVAQRSSPGVGDGD